MFIWNNCSEGRLIDLNLVMIRTFLSLAYILRLDEPFMSSASSLQYLMLLNSSSQWQDQIYPCWFMADIVVGARYPVVVLCSVRGNYEKVTWLSSPALCYLSNEEGCTWMVYRLCSVGSFFKMLIWAHKSGGIILIPVSWGSNFEYIHIHITYIYIFIKLYMLNACSIYWEPKDY